jgi:tRNA-dihydrouridine synthase B
MGEIIERVVAACKPVPVTAKIRLGCTRDQINAIDIAQVVEGAGASALTVHGRTAADFFKGSADWEKISEIRPFLKKIPLIGNGDLDSPRAVLEAFDRYAIDGVMIARAALGRPWLFRQAQAALRGEQIPADPSLEEQRQLLLHHFDLICRRFGTEKGCVLMRKYACCYAQGRRGARTFRSQVAVIETAEEFFRVVEESFPRDSETQSASETSPVSISSGPLTCSSTSTGGNEKTL